jgi:hypothetical protein
MDCRTARLVLEFVRPHLAELDSGEADALESHLAECPECKVAAKTEREADDRLGQALRDVAVPADLRDRLGVRLDRERKVAYRRWTVRRLREVAAAAAVLVAAWAGYALWQASNRTVIDPADIIANAEELRGKPPEELERWFLQKYSVRTVLPRNFNYAFLNDRVLQDYDHKWVVSLSFQRGENHAEVLVLTAKQFNLAACLAQPRAGSGGITVEILRCPTDPDIAYLIKYTGASLDWLVLENEVPAA